MNSNNEMTEQNKYRSNSNEYRYYVVPNRP